MGRIKKAVKASLKPSYKTIRWLFSIMIPVSLGVKLLEYFGVIQWMADFIKPAFSFLGLPGESALVILSGALLNIYSALAVIETLHFTIREITIMAIILLIAHNLIIETAIQKKTGSSPIQMVLVRLAVGFLAGYLFNLLLPSDGVSINRIMTASQEHVTFLVFLKEWGLGTLWLLLKIAAIITSLQILHNVLDEYKILDLLSRNMKPLMQAFGLPRQSSFMWLVANVVGLAWGSAILIEYAESGKVNRYEADLLNHHIAISHSLLEDTLLFVAFGVNALWITFPRIFLAMIVVWGLKTLLKNRFVSA